MRIIVFQDYHVGEPTCAVCDTDKRLHSIKTFANLDLLGGLIVHNSDWFTDDMKMMDYAIELKTLARDRSMYFVQPLGKLGSEELLETVRLQIRRKGWEGDYLIVPDGWRLIDQLDTEAIIDQLAKCNYVHLPTKEDEASWTQEMTAAQFEPVPEEGVGDDAPHFGKISALLSGAKDGHFVWSNGGKFKAVCEKA